MNLCLDEFEFPLIFLQNFFHVGGVMCLMMYSTYKITVICSLL